MIIKKNLFKKKTLFWAVCVSTAFLTACSSKGAKNNQAGIDYYNKGNYAEAVNSYVQAIEQDKSKPEYYINLAMVYIELGEYENAFTQIGFALQLDSENQAAYRAKGIICIALNDYANAILAFEQALNLADSFVGTIEYDILDYRAIAELKSGNYKKAIETYTILINTEYKKQNHYYLRGCAYLVNGNRTAALEDFKQVVKEKNASYDMYLNIYTALSQYGYDEEANQFLSEALTSGKGKKDDYFSKGKIYYYMKDYPNATTNLLSAKDAGVSEALFYLGKIYSATGDDTQAALMFQQYIESNPTNGEVYNQLGLIKLEQGSYQEALNYFQTGLSSGDLSAKKSLSYNEAITYEYLLDFQTAKEKFAAYVAAYPEDSAAVREYEFLKTR